MTVEKELFISGTIQKYPEELLDKRVMVEGNVIAAIYTDCLMLDEIKFTKDMFLSKDGRFYYSLAQDLRNKNFTNLDEVTILSNCTDEVIKRFEEKGGYEVLQHLKDVVNPNNFEVYIDQLYRENLLCKMHEDGFDLFKETEINGKQVKPLKLFRKMRTEEVIEFYESKLYSYDVGQSSSILEEDDIDFDDVWLNDLQEGVNTGTPYDVAGLDINGNTINCFPYLSNQTLGFRDGTLNVMAAFSSVGKSTWIITLLMAQMHYGRNVLIISNEEQITKFKSKFLMWCLSRYNRYAGLTKTRLEAGNLTDEDKKQINIARDYWRRKYKDKCHFISTSTTDMKVVAKKVREYVLKKGVDFVIFDTFKLADDSFSGERTDLALVKDSRELFNLARKYNICILATAQLAERHRGTLFLTAAQIGGAKAIKEICETLFEMRRVYPEELDKNNKLYLSPFRRKKINGIWVEDEYQTDPSKHYAVLFPEKNRNGQDSSNGEAYLLEFQGHFSLFKEVAFCKPKHGLIT